MPHDYKRRPAARKKRAPARRKSDHALPCWSWFIVGITLSAAILFVVARVQPQWLTNAVIVAQKPTQAAQQTRPAPQQSKGPDYTFYTVLPEMEVAVPPEALKPTAATSTQKSGLYQLQLASYHKREDADKMEASLALIGISARIEKVTINDKTFYRVRSGPYPREQAYGLHMRLRDHGVESLILKVRKNEG
jgi:cell division protein FtsN